MRGYRLVTYLDGGAPAAGVLTRGRVHRAADVMPDIQDASSVVGLIRAWDRVDPRLDAWAMTCSASDGLPLEEVTLEAPIRYPGAFFCAGANYWDHLEEMGEVIKRTTGQAPSMAKAAEPWFFLKTTAGTIVGDQADIPLPKFSKQVDWEAELGVVIARPARRLEESEALSAVAGFVIVNDLSARDLIKREGSPFIYDWVGQKCFDYAAPMGPWLTPARYVANPGALPIRLTVNGVTKQNSNTSKMVHGLSEQIAYLSRHVTLQPGDIIATGTPAGVGMARGEFLRIGDEVKIEIDGLGSLTNRIVASVV